MTLVPADAVYQAAERPIRGSIYWVSVSIVLAVVFGAYFGRTLATPLEELTECVLEIKRGNLEVRSTIQRTDEIGTLARQFNEMTRQLAEQKAEIEKQNEEMRGWNVKLRAEVEAQTLALREAQGYLIHTQKLAAVAEIASGVAHELNNPLATILGFTQILLADHRSRVEEGEEDPDLGSLELIEAQAQRCREIVSHLLRFSQEQVDRGSYDKVDLVEVIDTVLHLFEGTFASRNIVLHRELESDGLPRIFGNRAQLLQAFLQLFSAVGGVLQAGEHLTLSAEHDERVIRIVLQGPLEKIQPDVQAPFELGAQHDQAMAQSLGLWLARRIIQEHQGELELDVSDSAERARLIISLPIPGGTPAAA